MKAYKVTGKLGDICSFVGGNEVKKGDMVYLHSESDMKQQCVAKPQENDISIEAMKQALEFLESGNFVYPTKIAEDLRQALSFAQLSVNENSHAIEQASSVSSIQSDKTSDAEKQEPVAWADHGVLNWIADMQFKHASYLYPHPQPQREWVGLTDEEITKCAEAEDPIWVAKNVEAKLKEKNNVA